MLLIIPNSAHSGYQSKPGEVLTQKTPDVYFVVQAFKIKMFILVDRFKIYPLFSFFLDIFILICYNIKG